MTEANPVRGFRVDRNALEFVGTDLQRPECILAERDGTLWAADARGGVVRIGPDGQQRIISQTAQTAFAGAADEATRYTAGTLPNGLAFARNGDFLIANFGTDRLEVMTRDGHSRVLHDTIDGQPIGKTNFVLRDSRDRSLADRLDADPELDGRVQSRHRRWLHRARRRAAACASSPTASRSPTRSASMPTRSGCISSRPPASVSRACASNPMARLTDREVFGPCQARHRRLPGRHRLRCPR
jgi:hypothetical protein